MARYGAEEGYGIRKGVPSTAKFIWPMLMLSNATHSRATFRGSMSVNSTHSNISRFDIDFNWPQHFELKPKINRRYLN